MGNMDIEGRFQRFRDSLIRDVYEWTVGNGGAIELHDAQVTLEFDSLMYYSDVLGDVVGKRLSASADRPYEVIFTYETPEWSAYTIDYIEYGIGPEEHDVALSDLSITELYNILKYINL